jgi:PAS domain S-box-containing protein
MKLNPDERTAFIKNLSLLVYLLIALLWVKLLIETAICAISDPIGLCRPQMIFDILFGVLLTLVLGYVYRKFKSTTSEHVKEHARLFKNNPNPMWIYDLETLQFLKVNEAALSLYGYSEAEFLSLKITDIRPEEDLPAVISSTDKIKLHFNHQYHWSGTWRHKKKNDELIYVEISSHEILFEGEKAELVLSYNITERVLQDQKLQMLNQDLERKVMVRTNDLLSLNQRLIDQNKVIKSANLELFTLTNELQAANRKIQQHADMTSRFVSMASHEFRTPLANIAFSAGFIKRYLSKLRPENIISKLDGIDKHVTQMVTLLEDVLTIGKSDYVKLEINKKPFDLHCFINSLSQEIVMANNNSHKVHIFIDENVRPYLDSDEKFLRNVLTNLLNNAIKYSPSCKDIQVNVYAIANETCIEIIDRGIGIKKTDMERIFEPFYRAGNTENIKGTGLGLSIVKKAVDILGGRISVQSEFEKGSKFKVILPA